MEGMLNLLRVTAEQGKILAGGILVVVLIIAGIMAMTGRKGRESAKMLIIGGIVGEAIVLSAVAISSAVISAYGG